jgi:hypothetical protein
MESGGVLEPEEVQESDADLLSASFALTEPFEELPEETLLAVIGAYSLTPDEQRSTAVLRHAPEEISVQLLQEGLVVDAPVDLVVRGRKTIRRVLADWEEELREKICPLRARRGMRRAELVANVAAILAGFITLSAGLIAPVAVYLARFCLDELCHGWPGPRPIAPTNA